MYNRLLAVMACGLLLVLLTPFLSRLTLATAPIPAIIQLVGSVITILSGSLLLRAVLSQSNVAQ